MADEFREREQVRQEPREVGAGVAVYQQRVTSRPPILRRVSWGAIIAGAIVAVACQLLLTALGLAIGMAAVNPVTDPEPARTLATGAGIWWLVSGLISLFVGGLVAARMAAFSRWADGMLHGLVVWGLTAVASLFIVTTSLAGLIGGAIGGLRDAAVAAAANPDVTSRLGNLADRAGVTPADGLRTAAENIRREAQQAIHGAGGNPDGSSGNDSVDKVLSRLLQERGAATQADRDAAVNLLETQAGMDHDRAVETVRRWEQQYSQAGGGHVLASPEPTDAQARRTGQRVASGVSSAAMWAFVAMFLGAIASAFGGILGRPSRTIIAEERLAFIPAS